MKHKVFTEEVNKIVLSFDDDKKIQSIDSIEIHIHAYGTSEDLICKKKKNNKCNNIIEQYKNG